MFRFSLQTALEVRQRQEKIRMKELAEKVAIEQAIKEKINLIEQQTQNAEQNMNLKKANGAFTVSELGYLTRFKDKKKMERADYFQQLELAQKEVEAKQNILIQASKARKTLEVLRDKEQQRFLEKIAQIERKHMDEIAGNQFIQKKSIQ